MSRLNVWLPTRKADTWGGGPLYRREIDTPFLPRQGDMVHVVYVEEDGWTCGVRVSSVYWDGDGSVHAELLEHVLDPSAEWRAGSTQTSWFSDRDGDLHQLLTASGWRTE